MSWLIIAIIAYLLNAASLLTDKFLLTKAIKNPSVYAIFICLMGLVTAVLLPFGWQQPSGLVLFIELISGALFAVALALMFGALKHGEASRIVPVVGGLQPLIVLPLAVLFLGELMTGRSLAAFVLILLGSVIITYGRGRANSRAYFLALASAAFFAVSLVLAKFAFNTQGSFITPFVMTRIGAGLAAVVLLFVGSNFKDLMKELKQPKPQKSGLFIFGQVSGALSSVLVNVAIAISVNATALINALQGLQYVFLLAAVVISTKFFPRILKEDMSAKILAQKILATILIIIGLAVLSL